MIKKKYVYLVYTDYEEFKIFSNKEKANKFIGKYAEKEFIKSGLYKNKSDVTGKEYTIKDFIEVRNLKPQKHILN